jgi:hypothetical protein
MINLNSTCDEQKDSARNVATVFPSKSQAGGGFFASNCPVRINESNPFLNAGIIAVSKSL